MTQKSDLDTMFRFFSEVAIIDQLSTAIIARLLPDGMHTSHFATLNHLMRTGDSATPLAIAQAMQVSKATMTHTLGVLADKRLIEVRANSVDRRSKLVFLTEDGRAFRDIANRSLAPAYAWFTASFDIAELRSVLPLLTRVRTTLEQERSNRL